MIKTGDWTISDLTKYLVSVQDRLDPLEINRLQLTAAFTAENYPANQSKGQRPTRYRAGDLYEPSDIHRQLRLPIIDWGSQTKWHGSSPEGKPVDKAPRPSAQSPLFVYSEIPIQAWLATLSSLGRYNQSRR